MGARGRPRTALALPAGLPAQLLLLRVLLRTLPPLPLLLLLGHGVVQVQHEQRRRVVLPVRQMRPRPVRQPQDGQDLLLHLPLLVRAQPPVNEARVSVEAAAPTAARRMVAPGDQDRALIDAPPQSEGGEPAAGHGAGPAVLSGVSSGLGAWGSKKSFSPKRRK